MFNRSHQYHATLHADLWGHCPLVWPIGHCLFILGGKFEHQNLILAGYLNLIDRPQGSRARKEGRRADAGLRVEPAGQAAVRRGLGGGLDFVGGQVPLGRNTGINAT